MFIVLDEGGIPLSGSARFVVRSGGRFGCTEQRGCGVRGYLPCTDTGMSATIARISTFETMEEHWEVPFVLTFSVSYLPISQRQTKRSSPVSVNTSVN